MKIGTPGLSSPDPSSFLDLYVVGAGNPGVKDPALIAEIQHAETLSIGSKERTAAMQKVNTDLANALLWTPICQQQNIFVANKNVIGLDQIQFAAFSGAGEFGTLQVAKSS
jgi:ABC-type oligopeptide transport system substrate-binding subunit